MNVGDWIDTPYAEKGHRLSADGVDAICGFPLIVDGWTDGRLKTNTAVSRRCTICAKHEVDRLGLSSKHSIPRTNRPPVGQGVGPDRPASVTRRAAAVVSAEPIGAREQFARREFEFQVARIAREFEGSVLL